MTHKTQKKTVATKSTKNTIKKSTPASAKKMKAKGPHKAIVAKPGRPKEKSIPEVAATHMEHMAYGLGYRIPSAWWRHTG